MKYIDSKKFFSMSIKEIQILMGKYHVRTNFTGEVVNDQYEKERLWKILRDARNFKITIISLVFIVLTFCGTVLMIFLMK
ncbi:MAG: hypothetical protein ACYDIA_02345 [Candidatus Humimicrobiaceae bacterium]